MTYELNYDICLTSVVGSNTYFNLDSRFRINSNNTDTCSTQRFYNDGSSVSDAWLDLMKISVDTNKTKATGVMV